MSTATVAPVRLIMVTGDNNNKFYNMTPDGTEFIAEWGRVGVTSSTKRYPMRKWHSVYAEKTKKGYKDVTDLLKENVKKSEYATIKTPKIDGLFRRLLSFANKSVSDNYTISSESVTAAQLAEAQALVDELTVSAKVGTSKTKANKLLLDLYAVIPRRMKKVQHHLLANDVKTNDDLQTFRNIIDSEQQTLDVMAGQVKIGGPDIADASDKTILDALGISVDLGTDKDEARVRKIMGSDEREFRAVYVVSHGLTRDRYAKWLSNATHPKEELFWHGSRNENWISILQTGLKIRPSNAIITGAMFGHGIYFADKYRKSAGYTSLSGSYWTGGKSTSAFLALMDVHVGKQYVLSRHSHECYDFSSSYLKKKGGYDSVFAKGGYDLRNNEYIVYDEQQSTIKYLVEVGT